MCPFRSYPRTTTFGICIPLCQQSKLRPSHLQTSGFLTIDCGLPTGAKWNSSKSGLTYISDNPYVESGNIYNVSADIYESVATAFQKLRSFKSGIINCYTIPQLVEGQKYLVRTSFLYGNYDNLNSAQDGNPISFDIYLGSQFWESISITNRTFVYRAEVLTIARTSYISVCLRNRNLGVPFISLLELRPLNNKLYPSLTLNSLLILRARLNVGGDSDIRYPDDIYDRIWKQWSLRDCDDISTNISVVNWAQDPFEVPMLVLQSAITPTNTRGLSLTFPSGAAYFCFHCTTFTSGENNLQIYLNNKTYGTPFPALYVDRGYFCTDYLPQDAQYNFSIVPVKDNVSRAVLNAWEIYGVMGVSDGMNAPTNKQDVYAIMDVKKTYQIKRNWTGDPCSPEGLTWEGIICNRNASDLPYIIKLNLSSSGLNGQISPLLGELLFIDSLDLSNNNLTGSVPDFFTAMSSLRLLNLSGNKLSGMVPPALLQREQDNLLVLSIVENPDLIIDPTARKNKINKRIFIIIIGVPALLALSLLAAVTMLIKKSGCQESSRQSNMLVDTQGNIVQIDCQHFTYKDLEKITNNFQTEIGKGGFGEVYLGQLFNSSKVAVKVLNDSSQQGKKEFIAEVQHLSRIHHKNLVSLIGYCYDGNHMALVYEYLPKGNLHSYIRGRAEESKILSWEERLKILLGASQGIEYLHDACNPAIIHRDIKPANILLNEMLEAKVADFGLSKTFQNSCTPIPTDVVGTPGYLDPQYQCYHELNEKADVYSFGVVLLEVLTAKAPALVLENRQQIHISVWVEQRLSNGSVDDVIDPNIQGSYNVTSVWKIVDLAKKCMARTTTQRPNMSYVVSELKESLDLVLELKNKRTRRSESGPSNSSRQIGFEGAKAVDSLLAHGPSMR